MKILVLGCSGFIGPAMVRTLCAGGHEVIGVSRGKRPVDLPEGAVHIVANRDDPRGLRDVVRTHGIATVIDIIAMTEERTRSLLAELGGTTVERYVMLSSADVYRNFEGLHRRVDPGPVSAPLDEDSPLRTTRYMRRGKEPPLPGDRDRWLDDYEKITTEAVVRAERSLSWTILRLPMVFGPRDHQRRFSRYIRRFAQGRSRIVLGDTFARWRTAFGYIDDITAGIALAATHPAAAGRIYNLGRIDAPTQAEWVTTIGRFMGRSDAEVVVVGVEEAPPEQRRLLTDLDFRYPLRLDTGRIRRELGFREGVDEATALRRTIDDELAQPEIPNFAEDLLAEDAVLVGR